MNSFIKNSVVLAFFGATLLSAVQASARDDDDRREGNRDRTRQQQQVLHVTGGGAAYPCTVPVTNFGTTSAGCVDANITDLKTGEFVGIFTDALNDQQFTPDGGFVITSTSTFRLPLGDVVTRARVTVLPVSAAAFALNAALPNVTHITGSVPTAGVNNVLSGTKLYKFATGQYRVSGAVDLSIPGSEMFNCIFVLDLVIPGKDK